jgi:hypothetical protein
MTFLCDNQRHLICIPYSITNLHHMAMILKIKPCWFHKTHYDIPKRRIEEIMAKCEVISPRRILEVIKNPKLYEQGKYDSPSNLG